VTPVSLANRLHDIHELDPASIWPLATGWWLLLAAALLLVLLVVGLRRWRPDLQRFIPRYGWSRDAAHELTALRHQISYADTKVMAARLSELMRRIAIARCGRERCAGLHGDLWLAWLAVHDPAGFDWRNRGRLLLDLPYAPPGDLDQQPELRDLIDAALVWTDQPKGCSPGKETAHGV
jgi:hypothetical protein